MIGDWRVEMSVWQSGQEPATCSDDLTARKVWINGNRHIREEVDGTLGGKEHAKLTILGYNNLRQRYEFVTADNSDTVIMTYYGQADETGNTIILFGELVLAGYGPQLIGSATKLRLVFTTENDDRHALKIHYTEPAGEEYLFLEYIYTRKK